MSGYLAITSIVFHSKTTGPNTALSGGYSALRRLYSEVQEPMISAAQETFQPGTQEANPFAGLFPPTSQAGAQQAPQQPPRVPSVPAGTENTNPLPNPWAPPTSGAPPTSTSTPATGPAPGGRTLDKYS